jgi:YXWGXW repeat-containing protein
MKRSYRKFISGLAIGILTLTISVLSLSSPSSAIEFGIGISVRIGPPALPVYAQPICPGPGYLWTPGYWAWNEVGGYYWVPGTWVVAPVGMLWTPGYWGFAGGLYGWHAGYWGPHVGFYGGINYGFGYGGVGFAGGEWRGRAFFYNRAVMNVNANIRNVYNRTVIVNNVHTSFNGPGGIVARPTAREESYARERHSEALSAQVEHERAASRNRASFASENHGRPEIAATGRPGEFSRHDVVKARESGAAYREPARDLNRDQKMDRNSERSNDHNVARDQNRDSARSHEERSSELSKPSKEERRAQKQEAKATRTQAKADQKRGHEERR